MSLIERERFAHPRVYNIYDRRQRPCGVHQREREREEAAPNSYSRHNQPHVCALSYLSHRVSQYIMNNNNNNITEELIELRFVYYQLQRVCYSRFWILFTSHCDWNRSANFFFVVNQTAESSGPCAIEAFLLIKSICWIRIECEWLVCVCGVIASCAAAA